jgi:hypothetical protein
MNIVIMMHTTKKYAIMRAWPEDEDPIYLCSFHVLKIWKNHICTKIPNLGTLRDLIYRKLHFFIYVIIEYKEIKEYVLKRVRTIRKGLFNFLYVEKMEQFINVHYDHQSEYLTLLYLNFKL